MTQIHGMPEDDTLPDTVPGHLGDWCANLIPLEQRVAALFMNQHTQLSFVILEGRRFDALAIGTVFLGGMSQVLELHGYKTRKAKMVVDSYSELILVKNVDASFIAHMSNLARDYRWQIERARGLSCCDVGAVIRELNRRPRKLLNWATPEEATRERLAHIFKP